MNPNDLLAQQQAYVNQVMQNAQQTQWAIIALWLASMLISFVVIYLFYARLRDIADELRKIRVTYEMEQERSFRSGAKSQRAASGEN
jgi:phosphate/sulfate permease